MYNTNKMFKFSYGSNKNEGIWYPLLRGDGGCVIQLNVSKCHFEDPCAINGK